MTLINALTFDSDIALEVRATSGTFSRSTSTVRTGAASLRCNPTTTAAGAVRFDTNAATGLITNTNFTLPVAGLGFYFRYATKPSSNTEMIAQLTNSGGGSVQARINSSGVLSIWESSTPSQIVAGSTALSAGTWYRVFLWVDINTDTVGLFLDGATEIAATSFTMSLNYTTAYLGKATNYNGNSVDFFYDDAIVCDAKTEPAAGWACYLSVPKGAGAASGWTNGTGTTFAEADDVPNDGDTTYIQASATQDNLDHTFDMQSYSDLGSPSGTILGVRSLVYARTGSTSGTSAVGLRILVNSIGYELTPLENTTSYRTLARFDAVDPGDSSAWTTADFDSLEVGMFAGTIAQTQRFTVAYAVLVMGASGGTQYNQTVAPTVTSSLTMVRSAGKKIAATLTSAVTMVRSMGKSVSATRVATASIVKSATKTIAPALASTVSIAGAHINVKTVSAALTSTMSMIRASGHGQAISANVTSTLTIIRSVGKGISVTSATTVTVVKSVAKPVSLTVAETVLVTKSVAKSALTQLATTTSMARSKAYTRLVAASLSATTTVAKGINKLVTATANTTGTIFRSISKSVAANAGLTVSMIRSVGKTISVTATTVVSLGADFISGAGGVFNQSISVTTTTTTQVVRQVGKGVSLTVGLVVTASRGVAKAITSQVYVVPSIVKSMTKQVSVVAIVAPSMIRSVGITIPVTIHETAQLVRGIAKSVSLTVSSAVSVARGVAITISNTLNLTAIVDTGGMVFHVVMLLTVSTTASITSEIARFIRRLVAEVMIVLDVLLGAATITQGEIESMSTITTESLGASATIEVEELIAASDIQADQLNADTTWSTR